MFLMVGMKHGKDLRKLLDFQRKIHQAACGWTPGCSWNVKCTLLCSDFWKVVNPGVKDRVTRRYLGLEPCGNQSGPQTFVPILYLSVLSRSPVIILKHFQKEPHPSTCPFLRHWHNASLTSPSLSPRAATCSCKNLLVSLPFSLPWMEPSLTCQPPPPLLLVSQPEQQLP